MRHVKRSKSIIGNDVISDADVVAMDALLVEAQDILSGELV